MNSVKIGNGSALTVGVADNHSLNVNNIEPDLRPIREKNRYRYYAPLLVNSAGSADMIVDGSVNPVEFSVGAGDDFDTRVTNIIILLADTTISNNKFGALTALTNGFDIKVEEEGIETFIVEKAKTGGEIIVQTGLPIPFGSGADANLIKAYLANSDAMLINFPLANYIPGGFKMSRRSKNKLVAVVNDALAGLDTFAVRAIGYKHYPLDPNVKRG